MGPHDLMASAARWIGGRIEGPRGYAASLSRETVAERLQYFEIKIAERLPTARWGTLRPAQSIGWRKWRSGTLWMARGQTSIGRSELSHFDHETFTWQERDPPLAGWTPAWNWTIAPGKFFTHDRWHTTVESGFCLTSCSEVWLMPSAAMISAPRNAIVKGSA